MATTKTGDLMADGTVTVQGAIREFGMSRSRLYEWMGDGRLPYTMTSGRRLIPRLAIKRLLANGLIGTDDSKK